MHPMESKKRPIKTINYHRALTIMPNSKKVEDLIQKWFRHSIENFSENHIYKSNNRFLVTLMSMRGINGYSIRYN